jgi:hypothetical protein
VVVWFGTDDRGRAAPFAKRSVCLAVPRPGNPPMAYPQALRSVSDAPASYSDVVHPKDSKSGVVRAVFRVDSAGAVVPGAIAIVSSSNEAFSRVVLEVLPGYHYFPATIDGRPTPQVVQQDFEFALHYGPNRP